MKGRNYSIVTPSYIEALLAAIRKTVRRAKRCVCSKLPGQFYHILPASISGFGSLRAGYAKFSRLLVCYICLDLAIGRGWRPIMAKARPAAICGSRA